MAKIENVRGILSLVLAAAVLISGCTMNKSASVSPTPTPTPAPVAHSVDLSWDASPSGNLQGYRVYRGQTSGGPYTPISGTVGSGTLQFTDSSVLAGHQYFYVITSIDTSGLESAPSPEASAPIPTP